jgi:hypothetical protein
MDVGSLLHSRTRLSAGLFLGVLLSSVGCALAGPPPTLSADARTGHYEYGDAAGGALRAGVAVRVAGRWQDDAAYPVHRISEGTFRDASADGRQLTIVHGGRADLPELTVTLRLHAAAARPAWLEVALSARNTGKRALRIEGLRALQAGGGGLALAAEGAATGAGVRVLSDSYSEDRPILQVHDLGDEGAVHRAVGSQLLVDRASGRSFLVGALRSARWITIGRLHVAAGQVAGLDVESVGTTELARGNSLEHSPPQDAVELSLPLRPGERLEAEPLMVQLGDDCHAQLESYGDELRARLHARVAAPTPLGWWSWTSYYFGINQGSALTNASALATQLRALGYDYFHVDEGYQFARGEYATSDAAAFPGGMRAFESHVTAQGLLPGIWTAPFEVSGRSWVYSHHPEWLVRNAAGKPIHLGFVDGEDQLYALDPTHPGAQDYLRRTYRTLTRDWGIRYIKLDFMEDSAVEGRHYRPDTTALEAQRIGLQVIRDTVGDGVLLDKDGSPMLNPVGLVDTGRISVDTSHDYKDIRLSAGGVAARYWMNRRLFINDPDAFMVSRQVTPDVTVPLSLDEARSSIALAAVGGGMYQIGDDLPTLLRDADRRALVENTELIRMARWGHAARPLDLMTYPAEQGRASVYVLPEGPRRAIVTLFNWSDGAWKRELAQPRFGLPPGEYRVSDVLEPGASGDLAGWGQPGFVLVQPPHSVRMLRFERIDGVAPARAVAIRAPATAQVGMDTPLEAQVDEPDTVVAYHWAFGDGAVAEGRSVAHAFTVAGRPDITLRVERIDGNDERATLAIEATGMIDPRFYPSRNRRFAGDVAGN